MSLLSKMPQRTCMGCNVKKDKKDLIRIVKNGNGQINIDKTGKMEGRGAYICNNVDCLNKAIKPKRIGRVLKIDIKEEIYSNLKNIINGGEFIG